MQVDSLFVNNNPIVRNACIQVFGTRLISLNGLRQRPEYNFFSQIGHQRLVFRPVTPLLPIKKQ
jgi:hypothetical protein